MAEVSRGVVTAWASVPTASNLEGKKRQMIGVLGTPRQIAAYLKVLAAVLVSAAGVASAVLPCIFDAGRFGPFQVSDRNAGLTRLGVSLRLALSRLRSGQDRDGAN
jgi:hypothetical protein